VNNYVKKIAFVLLLFVYAQTGFAAESAAADGKIDVKNIVFSHIGDAYEWHVTELNGHPVAIPLPVIVYSQESGWNVFLSSKLHHGAHNGLAIAPAGTPNEGKIIEAATGERPAFDISITKNVLSLLLNSAVLIFIVLFVARWYKNKPQEAPKGLRGIMEMMIMDVHDSVIKACVGKDYKRYVPYLLTAFFFIFFNNLVGLIPIFPGGANLTGNIAVTLVLAFITFLVVNIFATKEYWREIFWPDVPVWLKVPIPIMPAIEAFGIITKPFALMIRLFANIMGGHAAVLGLTCLIFITASMGAVASGSFTVLSVLFSVFLLCVDLLVAYIQAYVFTMLSAVFIGLSRVQPHHPKKVEVDC
jgi:F-type H+-transporting ATPase subunit a